MTGGTTLRNSKSSNRHQRETSRSAISTTASKFRNASLSVEEKDRRMQKRLERMALNQKEEEGLIPNSATMSHIKFNAVDANFDDLNDFSSTNSSKKLNEENTAAAVCDLDRILSANAVDCQGIPIGQIAQAKLEELQTEVDNISQMSDSSRTMTFADRVQKIDPAIRESYSELGEVLCAYRCGKLPQLFNSLIHHAEWEDMLMLMTPEQWTPAAIKQATNLFASTQCVDDMSQRFFNMILLPRCRDEIMQFKKLNVYLFDSVRAAVRRPAAFFKGIIIPLCESGTCTKLEASILSQIITSVKIPMLHASACILRIAEISPYNPAYTIFLRAFITKKYNLPYQVIDSLTYHFYNFINQTPEQIGLLLLIWHESLLDFVSYYGQYLSVEQQQLLRDLVKKCKHPKFTPLIKEQLNRAACATDAAEQVGDVDSTRLKANYDMVDLNSSSGDESAPGEDLEA